MKSTPSFPFCCQQAECGGIEGAQWMASAAALTLQGYMGTLWSPVLPSASRYSRRLWAWIEICGTVHTLKSELEITLAILLSIHSENKCSSAINPVSVKVVLISFCWNGFKEVLIHCNAHSGGCSLCCWMVMNCIALYREALIQSALIQSDKVDIYFILFFKLQCFCEE